MNPVNDLLKQRALVLLGIIFSGLCWYFSIGLSGDFWFLLWIAPIPVLVISLKASGWQTFLISFVAYLIGRLSWFTYLVMVATIVPAVILTLLLPLIFALIVTLSRKIIIKTDSWLSIFVFPVFFTTFEFLLIHFSSDGTAASIAYSQANLLSVIQVASVTGILGITFLVTFVPSAVVFCWYYRNQKQRMQIVAGCSCVLLASAFLFGMVRINQRTDKNTVKVGLVVLDEKYHNMSAHPDFQKEKLLADKYVKEISRLYGQGAKFVVLPERAVNINKEVEHDIIQIFSDAAIQNRVNIVIGYTNFRKEKEHNAALVINEKGQVVVDYMKVHLVTGLESRFEPGNEIGLFKSDGLQAGTAICKDLDFPDFIRKYGRQKVGILLIPAWDFVVDDWLHSRMSILRGVEFGFSEIRAARQGRLTISDGCGRIAYEASCSNGQEAILLGEVSIQNRDTIYTLSGDWFGILNAIAAIGFIGFAATRNKIK
jgi:apolipoprotein N-acyltransferase